MEKEFIPYEQALALKELGFDEPCFNLYHKDTHQLMYKSIDGVVMIKIDNHNKTNHCSAPTFSQAFRWFREKYYLHAEPIWDLEEGKLGQNAKLIWFYSITKIGNVVDDAIDLPYSNTHEEAELECLKKLIEIVKE